MILARSNTARINFRSPKATRPASTCIILESIAWARYITEYRGPRRAVIFTPETLELSVAATQGPDLLSMHISEANLCVQLGQWKLIVLPKPGRVRSGLSLLASTPRMLAAEESDVSVLTASSGKLI